MTEAEWLGSDYRKLGEWYYRQHTTWLQRFADKIGFRRSIERSRKDRLFGCACCRFKWPQLAEYQRKAVEVTESTVDRAILTTEVESVDYATIILPALILEAAWETAWRREAYWEEEEAEKARKEFEHLQSVWCDFLRDVHGNLFYSVKVDNSWLTWNDGTVRRIAEAIYHEGTFHDLPVLGDALEEAGCSNQDLLNHCRNQGTHVRGCWVVDLLLGKQ